MSTTPKSKTLRRSLSTPYQKGRRSSSGCFAPFKSPAASSNTKNDSVTNKEETSEKVKQQIPCKLNTRQPDDKVTLANEVVQMHQKCQQLDQEIEELRKSYDEEELPMYVDKLHQYNEIKDIAQMLIGKIAEFERTTTKRLYERFGLDLDD